MKLLTLCSGIGAPEVAASWMGWEHAMTCEVDEFCRKVLYEFFRIIDEIENETRYQDTIPPGR